jgi:hypothetical protein
LFQCRAGYIFLGGRKFNPHRSTIHHKCAGSEVREVEIFTSIHHKCAEVREVEVFTSIHHKCAEVREVEVFTSTHHKCAEVR